MQGACERQHFTYGKQNTCLPIFNCLQAKRATRQRRPLLQLKTKQLMLPARDVPLTKNPSTGTAQQRLFLVLKVVLHAVVVISEVLRLSTKSRCSRCCRHISTSSSSLEALFATRSMQMGCDGSTLPTANKYLFADL